MAPTKNSPTKPKSASTRKPGTPKSKSTKNKTVEGRSGTGEARKAGRTVKEAAKPVRRAAGVVKRAASGKSGSSKKAGSRDQLDAIEVLTEDHRQVEELFVRFEKTGDGAHKRRQGLVQRITEALSIHASIEEEIFYPAARRLVADADNNVLEALEEHHVVKLTLAELETMDPGHERYGAKVTVLIENVRHHVNEEENQLFPAIRTSLDKAQRREIGDQLVSAKRTAQTRPHPEAPDSPPGNIVAQVLTAPLDAAANLNKAAARRVRDIVS